MKLRREKLYKIERQDGLNVLVETEGSKAHTEKRRFIITTAIGVISAIASVAAAILSLIAINR